jgi:hypothetical protein
MAQTAGDRSVRPQQWELCLTVIEPVDICPRLCVVASFAAKRRAVRPMPRHAVLKLTMMGILMARRAVAVFKSERQNFVGTMRDLWLMAITAGDGHVCAGQGVSRLSMLCDREE